MPPILYIKKNGIPVFSQPRKRRAAAKPSPRVQSRPEGDGLNRQREERTKNHPFLGLDRRLFLAERDGAACVYCGLLLPTRALMTVDHVVPVSRGGSKGSENLVLACKRCNQAKDNKTPLEWLMLMRGMERFRKREG